MSQNYVYKFATTDGVSDAQLRDSAALSVIGRSANSTGDPADIIADGTYASTHSRSGQTIRGQVLRVESGPLLKFGSLSTLGPTKDRYHPDRIPASGMDTSCSDNFLNNTEAATWRWANQGTSTIKWEMDTAFLDPATLASESDRFRWVTAPGAVDFTVTMKYTHVAVTGIASAGLAVLSEGTETTPTRFDRIARLQNTGGLVVYNHSHMSNYTGTGTTDGTYNIADAPFGKFWGPIYKQFRYVASTKVLTSYFGDDGMTWRTIFAATLNAHPISLGYWAEPRSSTVLGSCQIRVHWFRTFTSGVNGATAAQYTSGECGE